MRITLPGSITLRALANKILRHWHRGQPLGSIYRMAETTAENGDKIVGRIRFDLVVEETARFAPNPSSPPEVVEITIPAPRKDYP